MGIKIKFILIIGDAKMTKFMQACDVFEKSKVLGEIKEMTITMKAEEKHVTFTQCQRLIDYMAKKFPGEYNVSLIHLDSIIYEDKILLNTKGKCKPYINKEIRCISNGGKFYMLHHFLTALGIEFQLDEYCFVI